MDGRQKLALALLPFCVSLLGYALVTLEGIRHWYATSAPLELAKLTSQNEQISREARSVGLVGSTHENSAARIKEIANVDFRPSLTLNEKEVNRWRGKIFLVRSKVASDLGNLSHITQDSYPRLSKYSARLTELLKREDTVWVRLLLYLEGQSDRHVSPAQREQRFQEYVAALISLGQEVAALGSLFKATPELLAEEQRQALLAHAAALRESQSRSEDMALYGIVALLSFGGIIVFGIMVAKEQMRNLSPESVSRKRLPTHHSTGPTRKARTGR